MSSQHNLSPSVAITRMAKSINYWSEPFSFSHYPRNLFLLPLVLLFNHLVAIVELVSAAAINSLGLFSHGSHMIFNSIILTGLVVSVFANWDDNKRYSMSYIDFVIRTNFVVGVIFLSNSVVMGYLSVRNMIEPPEIKYESLFYLMPVPSLLLNLVNIYIVVHGPDDIDQARQLYPELEAMRTRRTSETIYYHIMANAFGSIGTIVTTVMVQVLGWTVADIVCSSSISVLMCICAIYLIKESIDMTVVIRKEPGVFTVSYYTNSEVQQLSNIFTV